MRWLPIPLLTPTEVGATTVVTFFAVCTFGLVVLLTGACHVHISSHLSSYPDDQVYGSSAPAARVW